ncbi:BglG family transcription antiterminator [Isobaculum melis]|uniref:Ascorbate-specific PTS system EIIA component n=1 Tax=Isobaculum melis TaxID=142588 RepID=A0A1H9UCU5_9LACT|nr:BglG family transcription antiterminator [Isobaculum melis]SES07266.1 Transcriptional antiterminator [Isobaculum melis]
MIDQRMSYVVHHSKREVTLKEAIALTKLKKEPLLSEIYKMNQVLVTLKYPQIQVTPTQLLFPEKISAYWDELLLGRSQKEIVFKEDERIQFIFLMTFMETEELSVFHYQEFLQTSKNTTLSDIKKLRELLKPAKLKLEYTRKTGFFLTGNEASIRIFARNSILNLMETAIGKWGLSKLLGQQSPVFYITVRAHFQKLIQKEDLAVVPSRIEETIDFISYVLCRMKKHTIQLKKQEMDELSGLAVYPVSQLFLTELAQKACSKHEYAYFTAIFMTVLQGEVRDNSLDFLFDIAKQIIHEMERLSVINFQHPKQLQLNLFYHLVPAFFRVKYEMPLVNIMIGQIKKQHDELFSLTKLALQPLQTVIGKSIPDAEIGYFTILFGGEIENQKAFNQIEPYRALILCPNGISSSLIMQAELKKLFPMIDFIATRSVNQMESISESQYDVIFSSVPVTSTKKVYDVQPLMSQVEKNHLFRNVQEDLLIPGLGVPAVDEIVEILLPYITLKEGVSKEKLYRILTKKMMNQMYDVKENSPMLSELLTKDMIQLTDQKLNWEAAIQLAAVPLVTQEKVTPAYVEAMIQKVKEFGAFIHIGKGIALPHARPEDGVNKVGMSLLKVEEPVLLLDDEKHPITIFICLAAIDNQLHLKALASLTRILSNQENLAQLLAATTIEEIIAVIQKEEE